MAIGRELLDRLLAGRDPKELFAKDGLLDDLKKALSERILNAELDEHLDGERVEEKANRRNGHSRKSVLTGTSKIELSIPRDRAGASGAAPMSGTVGYFVREAGSSSEYEALAKDDGELRFGLDPLARRPLPFLGRMVEDEV